MPKYITRSKVKDGSYPVLYKGRSIPFDVVAYIAGFLWDDLSSLKVATLVCHSWRDATFSYLFRCIRIHDLHHVDKVLCLLEDEKIQGAWVRELRLSFSFFLLSTTILNDTERT